MATTGSSTFPSTAGWPIPPGFTGQVGFQSGPIHTLWVIPYTILVTWGIGIITECLLKTFTKEPEPDADPDFPYAYTWTHRLANVSRTVRDGFIMLFAAVVITGSGYGSDHAAVGVLWAIFAVHAFLVLTKLVVNWHAMDAALWFIIWVLMITAFGLAYR